MEADVSRTDDLRRLIQTAVAEFGRLDVLVSNAGIETRTSLLETSEADFDKVLAVNLRARSSAPSSRRTSSWRNTAAG